MEEEISCKDTSSVITKQTQAFTIDFGEPKNNQEHIKALKRVVQRSSQRRISSLHSNNFKNESESKEESEPTSEELALVENKGDKDILTKLAFRVEVISAKLSCPSNWAGFETSSACFTSPSVSVKCVFSVSCVGEV